MKEILNQLSAIKLKKLQSEHNILYIIIQNFKKKKHKE